MKKHQTQLMEAVDKFNGLLNARLRFFIGAAIKDALVLGQRSELLTEDEAQDLLDVVETDILKETRDDEQIREFLGDSPQPQQDEQTESDAMTPKEYYDIFIKPALEIIGEEYAERIGRRFVKYICTGEIPADNELSEDEKVLWNVFMMMVEIKFNPDFSEFISDNEE